MLTMFLFCCPAVLLCCSATTRCTCAVHLLHGHHQAAISSEVLAEKERTIVELRETNEVRPGSYMASHVRQSPIWQC
jgi:hypothetical protein